MVRDALTELQLVDLGVNALENYRRLLPAARREKALCVGDQPSDWRVGGANARLIRGRQACISHRNRSAVRDDRASD